MTITGAAIGNYTLIQPTGLKANISAKELTVTGATAKDKEQKDMPKISSPDNFLSYNK
jgi:hypothetical protein